MRRLPHFLLALSALAVVACVEGGDASEPGPVDRGAGETGPVLAVDGGGDLENKQLLQGVAGLKVAQAGDTVVLDQDAVGPLVVPPGVTLLGASPTITVSTTGAGAAVIAQTDAEKGPTVVGSLTLRPTRGVGLLVMGNGAFSGGALLVEVEAGVGIAAEGPKSFSLRDSQLRGRSTPGALKAAYFPIQSIKWPVLGLALSKVGHLELKNVGVERFVGVGALLWRCTGSWIGGRVGEQVAVGIHVSGGDISLEGLVVDRSAASTSVPPPLPTFGMIITGDAKVRTKGLTIAQNEGVGLLQSAGSSEHDGLLVADNTRIGIRVQDGGSLILRKSTVARNRAVGLFARGFGLLALEDSVVRDTAPLPIGRLAEQLGDGLQVVMPAKAVKLLRVDLIDNHRAACLLAGSDPGVRTQSIVVSGLRIKGQGSYGMVLQGGMSMWASWDYWTSSRASVEGALPSVMTLADTVAVPSLGPVGGSLIGTDGGQITPTGGVTIQIGGTGLDPGRGP